VYKRFSQRTTGAWARCGICPFKWSAAQQKWIAYPYNFFVFPQNGLHLELPSWGFFSQTTSLEFLTRHWFDFNECIYDGISYLLHEQEATARALVGLVPGKAVLPSGA
jgi:poly(A)-specific ribonuclease